MKTILQTLFFFLLITQICFGQWVQLGLEDKGITDIAAMNSTMFAVTTDSAVYRSTDNGINWLQIVDSRATDIAISPCGLSFLVMVDSLPPIVNGLYKTSDNGNTWINTNIIEQLQPDPYDILYPINISVSPTGTIFCGLLGIVFDYTSQGNKLETVTPLSCTATHIALSKDNGLSWETPSWELWGGYLFDFKDQFVITSGYFGSSGGGAALGLYLSSDSGNSWIPLGDVRPLRPCVLGFYLNGNILTGFEDALCLSTDMGNSWTKVGSLHMHAGLSLSNGLLVGNDSLGVFLFSDNGDSLGSRNDGLSNLNVQALTLDNNGYVYAGTENGVWRRPISEVIPVELISLTAATNGKEVILNWSTATELNNQGFEVQRSTQEKEFFTVGFVNGHGTTTEQQNYSYADRTLDDGKYYYRLKQIDYDGTYEYSDVVEVDFRTLNSYLLEQCYPNPFNPTTTIGFGVQNKSNVKITILNAIGEEVAVVLNEEREAGFHQVEFSAKGGSASSGNAYNLPSGVYFYQLKAGDFIQTKKMILLK